MHDVIVIGGGVIGLSIARELGGRKSVLLLDRGATGQGTSRAAAGMLSPLSEADDQGPFFQLCRESRAFSVESRFAQEFVSMRFRPIPFISHTRGWKHHRSSWLPVCGAPSLMA